MVYCYITRQTLNKKESGEETHVSSEDDNRRQKTSQTRSNEVAQVTGKPNDNKGDAEALSRFQDKIFVNLRRIHYYPVRVGEQI